MSDDPRSQTARGNVRDGNSRTRTARRQYSAEYKIRILAEYEALDRHGKGRLLIREGLYTSLLSQWRHQRDQGARAALTASPGRRRVDAIGRENARLRSRVEQLRVELERARRVIESQTTLSALLDEITPDKVNSDLGAQRSAD
jgi:transposase